MEKKIISLLFGLIVLMTTPALTMYQPTDAEEIQGVRRKWVPYDTFCRDDDRERTVAGLQYAHGAVYIRIPYDKSTWTLAPAPKSFRRETIQEFGKDCVDFDRKYTQNFTAELNEKSDFKANFLTIESWLTQNPPVSIEATAPVFEFTEGGKKFSLKLQQDPVYGDGAHNPVEIPYLLERPYLERIFKCRESKSGVRYMATITGINFIVESKDQ